MTRSEALPEPENGVVPPFRADRWRARWSQQGALLEFADGRLATAVQLAPGPLASLARQLAEAVAAHEQRSGLLWSEDGERHGAANDARLQWTARPFAAPLAHRLYGLVRQLPLSGFERSFKLLAGQCWPERFLVGLPTRALALEDARFLARQMEAPAEFQTALDAHWARADFFHVGFEAAAGRSLCKLYLEFASGASSAAQADALPLYLGYKWDPLDPASRTVSSYRQPAALAPGEIGERIAQAYGAGHAEVSNTVTALCDAASHRAGAGGLRFVEVRDDRSPRLSFDVNLYESLMTLREMAAPVRAVAALSGVPAAALDELLDAAGHDLVGHVSGGTDRQGRAFLTVYHTPARPAAG